MAKHKNRSKKAMAYQACVVELARITNVALLSRADNEKDRTAVSWMRGEFLKKCVRKD